MGWPVVCLTSVLLLGTVAAVLIAFVLTVIDVVRRAAPSTGVLGALPGLRGFLVIDDPSRVHSTPGLVVFRFGAQLFFANVETFRQPVAHLVSSR